MGLSQASGSEIRQSLTPTDTRQNLTTGNAEKDQTVYQQPALISGGRVEMIANLGPEGFDGLSSILTAAVGNGDLLRVRRRDEGGQDETLYAYARDVAHPHAVIETVVERDPTPKDLVGYCSTRIDELRTR